MEDENRVVEPESEGTTSAFEETEETEESVESSEENRTEAPELPDKFRDKPPEEIYKSYQELEKELGRKSNEIGELRRLTDQFLRRELENKDDGEPKERAKEVTSDDFFNDPKEAVSNLLESDPRLREIDSLKNQLTQQQLERARQDFVEKHPDYLDVAQDQDFQEWVSNSPVRQRLYREADQGNDFEAADELLSLWKERKELSAPRKKDPPEKAKLESGASKGSSRKMYRRADLIRLRMEDPLKYESMGDEIRRAYEEGRVK